MTLIALSLLALLTGVLLFWYHTKVVDASNGNESGYISFFLVGVWSGAQVALGALFSVIWLITRTEHPGVWWTFVALYALSFTGPAILFVMQVHYFLTDGGLPESWSSGYLRCKHCGRLYDFMHPYCDRCGSDEMQAVMARRIFDWRKPRTWRNRWEISPWKDIDGPAASFAFNVPSE